VAGSAGHGGTVDRGAWAGLVGVINEASRRWALERPFVARLNGAIAETCHSWSLGRPFVAGLTAAIALRPEGRTPDRQVRREWASALVQTGARAPSKPKPHRRRR
jgi:hypothetical protein